MAQKNWSIGVDIGGTHITCAAVQIEATAVAERNSALQATRSRESYDHEAPAAHILERWASALNQTISAIDLSQLAGIGFAIPGPFEYRNGVSKMQHKFKNLYGIHIPTALGQLLAPENELPMRFLNDASAFAVGEAWLGEGRGFGKVVVVTLGTGFGSAFIDDGVPVVAGGGVPEEGCLWHLPFHDGIADHYFSTGWFLREYEKRTGQKVDGVKTLADRVGVDAEARGLFAQFGRNLAECLAPWLQKFGAEVLVVGGNIAHALPLFEADFSAGLHTAGVAVKIAPSRLMEDAALIGSARLLDEVFWEKVSAQLPNI